MDRVVITKYMMGLLGMQVCAERDATNEEILSVCNNQNPSGTSHGWTTVVRTEEDSVAEGQTPVQCEECPDRLHFIIFC